MKLCPTSGAKRQVDFRFVNGFFCSADSLPEASPAQAAGVTTHLWSVADLVALWEAEERRLERAA